MSWQCPNRGARSHTPPSHSNRKSISSRTTRTFTLFPISRYWLFLDTPSGH